MAAGDYAALSMVDSLAPPSIARANDEGENPVLFLVEADWMQDLMTRGQNEAAMHYLEALQLHCGSRMSTQNCPASSSTRPSKQTGVRVPLPLQWRMSVSGHASCGEVCTMYRRRFPFPSIVVGSIVVG
jgi:hypothetical protein